MSLELLRSYDVGAMVSHRVPLADAGSAYAALHRGDDGVLGVLIDHAAGDGAA